MSIEHRAREFSLLLILSAKNFLPRCLLWLKINCCKVSSKFSLNESFTLLTPSFTLIFGRDLSPSWRESGVKLKTRTILVPWTGTKKKSKLSLYWMRGRRKWFLWSDYLNEEPLRLSPCLIFPSSPTSSLFPLKERSSISRTSSWLGRDSVQRIPCSKPREWLSLSAFCYHFLPSTSLIVMRLRTILSPIHSHILSPLFAHSWNSYKKKWWGREWNEDQLNITSGTDLFR